MPKSSKEKNASVTDIDDTMQKGERQQLKRRIQNKRHNEEKLLMNELQNVDNKCVSEMFATF